MPSQFSLGRGALLGDLVAEPKARLIMFRKEVS